MDEGLWRLVKMFMWAIGIQTFFIISMFGVIWSYLSKSRDDSNSEPLDDKVKDIDRRLCRIEGGLVLQGHCLMAPRHTDRKES